MARQPFDVVITDMRMPEMTGTGIVERSHEALPQNGAHRAVGPRRRQMVQENIGVAHQWWPNHLISKR